VLPELSDLEQVCLDDGTDPIIHWLHRTSGGQVFSWATPEAYVSGLDIRHLRCLRDTRLEIPAGVLWTVCLGENGTG